jgi:hypothetical protein
MLFLKNKLILSRINGQIGNQIDFKSIKYNVRYWRITKNQGENGPLQPYLLLKRG